MTNGNYFGLPVQEEPLDLRVHRRRQIFRVNPIQNEAAPPARRRHRDLAQDIPAEMRNAQTDRLCRRFGRWFVQFYEDSRFEIISNAVTNLQHHGWKWNFYTHEWSLLVCNRRWYERCGFHQPMIFFDQVHWRLLLYIDRNLPALYLYALLLGGRQQEETFETSNLPRHQLQQQRQLQQRQEQQP